MAQLRSPQGRNLKRAIDRETAQVDKLTIPIIESFEKNILLEGAQLSYKQLFKQHNQLWLNACNYWNGLPHKTVKIKPKAFFDKYAPVKTESKQKPSLLSKIRYFLSKIRYFIGNTQLVFRK